MRLQPIIDRLRELSKDQGLHGSLALSMLSRLPEPLDEATADPPPQIVAPPPAAWATGRQLDRILLFFSAHPGTHTTKAIAEATDITVDSLLTAIRISGLFECVEHVKGRGGWKKWSLRRVAASA